MMNWKQFLQNNYYMDIIKKASALTAEYMNNYQSPDWLTSKGINSKYKDIYDIAYEYYLRILLSIINPSRRRYYIRTTNMDVGLILSSYNNTFKYYIQQLFNIWKDKGSISILVDLDLKSNETKHSINDAIMIIKNAQELGAKIIVNSKEPNKYTLYKNYLEVFDSFCISSSAKYDIILSSNAGLEQAMLILQETARYYKLYKNETNNK